MNRKFVKPVILVTAACLLGAFFYFDLQSHLSLAAIQSNQSRLEEFVSDNFFSALTVYFLIYVFVTALALPAATVLTLLGGFLFGLLPGTLIVSFASTIGATLAFLFSRFLFRDWVRKKFSDRIKNIEEGVKREGVFYLFALRLIPYIPFFLINLIMGLLPIKTLPFFFVSQLGMLPATIVYVNAGTQLSKIETLSDIVTWELLLSFTALGLLPYFSKKIVELIRSRRVYKAFKKPRQFDYNLISIGGGAAGLVSSYIGAAVRAKVLLIEKHKMGGDCLNTGCVPSKALLKSAKIAKHCREAARYGVIGEFRGVDYSKLMERVHGVIQKIEPNDSIERYKSLGVDCMIGKARIKSPWEVEVDGKIYTTRNIVVASGAAPLVPPIPGLDKISYRTTDSIWSLSQLPKEIVILGGGPIGCELSQAFARLGSAVTLVEMSCRLLVKEDTDASELIHSRLKEEGVRVMTSFKAKEIVKEEEKSFLLAESQIDGEIERIPIHSLLLALGRKARVKGFGLEELGVQLDSRGCIKVDSYMRTSIPNVLACGDVAGRFQFTHTAGHEAWYASVNALFSPFKKFKVDYSVIPWVTFTDPEVARVGLSEEEAQKQKIEIEVTQFPLNDLDRSIAEGESIGFVKVLTKKNSDKILGVLVVGSRGGEMLHEFVLAMKHGIGLNKILSTVHAYPTFSDAAKLVAGRWKQKNVPEKLMPWIEKFHSWRRS